jgi:hypothetical protein
MNDLHNKLNPRILRELENEKKYLGWLNDPKYNKKQVQMTMKSNTKIIGLYKSLLDKNQESAKLYLSTTGMLFDLFNESYNRKEEYWFPVQSLAAVLISGNDKLYKIINQRKKINLSNDKTGLFIRNKALFEIALGDWIKLEKTYTHFDKIYEHHHNTFDDKKQIKMVYQAFLEKDVNKLNLGLNSLETKTLRRARQKHANIEKYISVLTLAFAKLAWMHGMEVEIDSKYVPKELLPFKPLEEYTIPYKFLRDFYRKQGLDWRYDPVHPELQNWENDPENPDRKKGGLFGKLLH